jgi:hypothetical protein
MKKIRVLNIANKIFLCLALFNTIGFAIITLTFSNKFLNIYDELNTSFPKLSLIFLSIPFWGYLLISIIGIIILILKERLSNKFITLLINIIIMGFMSICIFLYVKAMFLPIFNLQLIK